MIIGGSRVRSQGDTKEANNNRNNNAGKAPTMAASNPASGGSILSSPRFATSVDFDTEWAKGLAVVRNLLSRKNVSQKEWQELFFINSQITCWANNGCDRLFTEFKREIHRHVTECADAILATEGTAAYGSCGDGEEELLRRYVTEWENYWVLCCYLPLPFNFIEKEDDRGKKAHRRRYPLQQPKLFDPAAGRGQPPQMVRDAMLECWNRMVFEKASDRLLAAAMRLVERERGGEIIEQRLVIGVRESYVELYVDADQPLDKYTRFFEQFYLGATERFYEAQTARVFASEGILGYMRYADEKLVEEEQRAKRYLHDSQEESNGNGGWLRPPQDRELITANRFLKESANLAGKQLSSVDKLVERCVQVLIQRYQSEMLNEATSLIVGGEMECLRRLYRLINRTPSGISSLLERLAKHIGRDGLEAMRANADVILRDCEKFVEQLLAMYERFSALVREAFYNDPRFLTVRDKAFQEVINSTAVFSLEIPSGRGPASVESRCPQLLANYCDMLLRKSTKHLSLEAIDEKLNNLLLMLKYVRSKDVFMRYYKANLSHRLIFEMATDQELEEQLVQRFRETGMPADYVQKLFRMLQDIEVNKDLNTELRRHFASDPPTADSTHPHHQMQSIVSVKILNAGAWSRASICTRSNADNNQLAQGGVVGTEKMRAHHGLALPSDLDDYMCTVEEHYKRKHTGRRLNWVHHWSTGTITFANQAGRYELKITAPQMSVLFTFNARPRDAISYEHLRLSTGLTDSELDRALLSMLASPKLPNPVLLTDHPMQHQDNGKQGGGLVVGSEHFPATTLFWLNQSFAVMKGDRPQPRGKVNLIGRLQLGQAQEAAGGDAQQQEQTQEIAQLRVLRTQEAIVKVMKTRRKLNQAQLQTELIEVLKNMFLPSNRLIKEQIEWLLDNGYLRRHDSDMNTFVYCT